MTVLSIHAVRKMILASILTGYVTLSAFAQHYAHPKNVNALFARLDLDMQSLEEVHKSKDDPQEALSNLLEYYKNRSFVSHPVTRRSEGKAGIKVANKKDLKVAENALKHIFVGQPAYPPYYCGEDIDWSTSPVPDKEWVWQLNRMSFWDAMGRVYMDTGDEKYARAWGDQLMDWTLKNPRDKDHRYAWRSIEAGIRGYRWTGLFQRFIDSPSFTPEVLVAFLNSCYDHAEYLMTRYSSGSNWGLMEAEGLAFIAITFPEFKKADQWRKEAFRRLNKEISIQVNPDGHQRELAIGYHLGCIRWFMRTYELARMNGIEEAFPETYLTQIEKMCEVPMKLGLPNGLNVPFGDAWEGKPDQHNQKYKAWADFFDRDDFRYLGTEGKEGIRPDSTAYALKHNGLYSMRSGWDKDDICMVLKCGPDGGGHSQRDNGTFDLYAGGRNLMPDAGSYIYSGDPEGRAWFRQTSVHQTLTLDGKNTQYDPQLLLWQPGDSLDVLVVENGSYDNLTHRRSVFFIDKRYFVIMDEAMGSAQGDVNIHFQLAPGKALFVPGRYKVTSEYKEGWNVMVRANPIDGMKLEKEEGWVSFEYTQKEPRPAFRYTVPKNSGDQNIRFVTVVAPYEHEEPDIIIKNIRTIESLSGFVQIELKENGKKRTVRYSLDGADH